VADAADGLYPFFYSGLTVANPEIGAQDYAGFSENPMQVTTIQFTATICSGCQLILSGPQHTSDAATGTGSLQTFAITYEWYGNATLSAPLHIVVADATGTYTSRAEVPSTALVATGTTTLSSPTFTSIASGAFSVTPTLPAGYTYYQGRLEVEENGPTDYSELVDTLLPTVPASAKYPVIPGSSLFVALRATGASNEESDGYLTYPIASAPASATITLPMAPQLTGPANNATGVTSADALSWTSYGTDSVYELYVAAGNTQLKIFTPGTSVSLAKLAKAEIGLAPATLYSWTSDAATGEATVFGTFNSPPASVTYFEGESSQSMFTTQ
jgi:hypothetical protein